VPPPAANGDVTSRWARAQGPKRFSGALPTRHEQVREGRKRRGRRDRRYSSRLCPARRQGRVGYHAAWCSGPVKRGMCQSRVRRATHLAVEPPPQCEHAQRRRGKYSLLLWLTIHSWKNCRIVKRSGNRTKWRIGLGHARVCGRPQGKREARKDKTAQPEGLRHVERSGRDRTRKGRCWLL
jgi:hypothetical protein